MLQAGQFDYYYRLGPTMDDLTKETIADLALLTLHEPSAQDANFLKTGKNTDRKHQTSHVSERSCCLPNNYGTAAIIEKDSKCILCFPASLIQPMFSNMSYPIWQNGRIRRFFKGSQDLWYSESAVEKP